MGQNEDGQIPQRQEQRVVLRKEKPSVNGELVAGTILGCEEPGSKMEPQTK